MAQDKRRFPRFKISQMVDIAFPRETFFHAEGVNISEGGMLCKTNYDIEPLSQVFFMVNVEHAGGSRMVKTRGTVIHTRKDGDEIVFGVSFDEIDEADRAALQAYIQELRPESDEGA